MISNMIEHKDTPQRLPLVKVIDIRQKIYDLTVRFGGSKDAITLCRGSHEECLHACKVFVLYTISEHKVHSTGRLFTTSMITSDRIIITSTKVNVQYPKSSLWATFEIREVSQNAFNS